MNKLKFFLVALVVLVGAGYYMFKDEFNELLILKDKLVEQAEESQVEVRKRVENGELKADAEFVNDKRNGVANNYYSDGSVHSSVHYKNDVKHGESTWYYRDGTPYRVTNYVNGKKDGVQKKFYETGRLMVEIPYKNGELQEGTVEYWETGKKKSDYPELLIDQNGGKRLLVSLQPHVKKATYYAVVKHGGKTVKVTGVEARKEAEIDLSSYSGEAIVYVLYKTKMNNKKLLTRKVSL